MNRSYLAVALALMLADGRAHAASFCVSTPQQLQDALQTASSNGVLDSIRIVQGTYAATSGAIAFAYASSEDFAINIGGGYTAGCAQQVQDPTATVLSGSDVRQVLRISNSSGSSGAITLTNLTIRDGFSSQPGAGAFIGGAGGYTGNVVISRVIFERNVSTNIGGGLAISADGGTVQLVSSLFMFNRCTTSNCAITSTVNAASAVNHRAFFGNNTVVFNQCTAGATCNTTGIRHGGSARAVFYNNAFAGNTNGDLALQSFGGGSVDLYHNNLVTLTGDAPASSVGNLNFANPQFIDILNDDFRLRFSSPLRNAGFNGTFPNPQLDLAGQPRVNDFVIDIGAYEEDTQVFSNGFETLL